MALHEQVSSQWCAACGILVVGKGTCPECAGSMQPGIFARTPDAAPAGLEWVETHQGWWRYQEPGSAAIIISDAHAEWLCRGWWSLKWPCEFAYCMGLTYKDTDQLVVEFVTMLHRMADKEAG